MQSNLTREAEELTAQLGHFRADHCAASATAMRFTRSQMFVRYKPNP